MKWFLNSCRRNRESLCLLASGLLPEPDRVRIENHLAGCADCRSYYDEIKAVTAPLAGWEKHFAQIEPDTTVHVVLAKAGQPASGPTSMRRFTPGIILVECWQQLVWPSRRVWAGLAAVWLALVVVNVSQRDNASSVTGKIFRPGAAMMSLQVQQRWMNELLVDRSAPPAAERPQNLAPKPHTQNCGTTAV
ncbi:MAG TPA: zf-HC2 domain-containing protein [Candidatus Sulfopaludibacter sp.]|nr:zf-HC2 domain-containing protein [Candidatus Sulfopaludibacter sp.]